MVTAAFVTLLLLFPQRQLSDGLFKLSVCVCDFLGGPLMWAVLKNCVVCKGPFTLSVNRPDFLINQGSHSKKWVATPIDQIWYKPWCGHSKSIHWCLVQMDLKILQTQTQTVSVSRPLALWYCVKYCSTFREGTLRCFWLKITSYLKKEQFLARCRIFADSLESWLVAGF